jgi:predicted GTPase
MQPEADPVAPPEPSSRRRVLILGAAGRDFHDFNMVFRDRPDVEVVAFTATQIPQIAGRLYPPSLAGPLYPAGIPILPEREMDGLLADQVIDEVVFAYSDVSHAHVMHLASRAVARGADFRLLGTRATMLRSRLPVVSVCAVRTGAGKSPASRRIAALLREQGRRVAVLRHPMPYGDLERQAVQRFARMSDLDRNECTIEEREEYEPHLRQGDVVYAGVDYERILRAAEEEADVILWDGGNNDTPFVEPDLEIVCVDPHRAGHETSHYPGEANFLRADVLLLTKMDSADERSIRAAREAIRLLRPDAPLVESAMPVRVDDPEALRGRRALVIEDGPTLTHGGMPYGAGLLAARAHHAYPVDPRPVAVGSLKEIYAQYPHMGPVLPAMGYGPAQVADLERTIAAVDCDIVLVGTPIDLRRVVRIDRPTVRARYELEELGRPKLADLLSRVLDLGERDG